MFDSSRAVASSSSSGQPSGTVAPCKHQGTVTNLNEGRASSLCCCLLRKKESFSSVPPLKCILNVPYQLRRRAPTAYKYMWKKAHFDQDDDLAVSIVDSQSVAFGYFFLQGLHFCAISSFRNIRTECRQTSHVFEN